MFRYLFDLKDKLIEKYSVFRLELQAVNELLIISTVPEPSFKADHPFLSFIVLNAKTEKTPLFMQRLINKF